MSSQFNHLIAQSHAEDLRRYADRPRRRATTSRRAASPFPTSLRPRRLGHLLRVLAPSSRPSA
jgi:hypothetical protein